MTERYDMKCDQGATFIREITLTDNEGNPLNYTGYTAEMQVRKSHSDPAVVLDLNTDNGRITVSGAIGMFRILVSDEDTSVLVPRTYVYDLLAVSPEGTKDRILEGSFIVSPGVTRAGG